MAQVRIRRNSGVFGKLAGLDVLVGNQRVATLHEGEQRILEGVEDGAQVYVEMQGHIRSRKFAVSNANTELECGSNWWLAIDWMDFCYLPVLREHVFYLRPLAKRH